MDSKDKVKSAGAEEVKLSRKEEITIKVLAALTILLVVGLPLYGVYWVVDSLFSGPERTPEEQWGGQVVKICREHVRTQAAGRDDLEFPGQAEVSRVGQERRTGQYSSYVMSRGQERHFTCEVEDVESSEVSFFDWAAPWFVNRMREAQGRAAERPEPPPQADPLRVLEHCRTHARTEIQSLTPAEIDFPGGLFDGGAELDKVAPVSGAVSRYGSYVDVGGERLFFACEASNAGVTGFLWIE